MVSFDSLADVPVHYDRRTAADYGTRGTPWTFQADKSFLDHLVRAFEDLWEKCPWGRAEVITSAGAYVSKPGYHGRGNAFDLDGIFWVQKEFVALWDGHRGRDLRAYLGIESVLRRHFGTVLNFHYNAAHLDHIHVDNSTSPGWWTSSPTRVKFLQMVLGILGGGSPVEIDGIYGPKTRDSARELLSGAGLAADLKESWLPFLDWVSRTTLRGHNYNYDDAAAARLVAALRELYAILPLMGLNEALAILNVLRREPGLDAVVAKWKAARLA